MSADSGPLEKAEKARAKLLSAPDEEDTGRFEVPVEVPVRVKGMLAALFSLPPRGRTLVVALFVAGCFAMVWRFGPAIVGLFYPGQ